MAFFLPMVFIPLICPRPPTPKTDFQSLPAEIKLLIIKQLDLDSFTLSRVAACNRELYHMAMPTLYGNVSLGAPRHYRIWPRMGFPADRRSIEGFLLTILRNPDIARLVKFLDLTDLHDLCYEDRQSRIQPGRRDLGLQRLHPRDHGMIMTAGMNLPLYLALKVLLRRALEPEVPRSDALLAVLLGYLPSLQRLEISMEHEDPYTDPQVTNWNLIERVLMGIASARPIHTDGNSILASSTPMLSKLTHLKAEINGDMPSADIDWLMVLPQIPTLTHVFGTKWTNAVRWLRPGFVNTDRLVHLELRECTFDCQSLERLLKQTHKLQTFIYERGWTKRAGWGVKASEMTHALQHTSKTLTCLELSFNRCHRRIKEELYLQPLDLSRLVHLKRLRLSAGYLVQTEEKMARFKGRYRLLYDEDGVYNSAKALHYLLPKSLEELHIFQIHDDLEFTLMSNKLCESLWTSTLPILSECQLKRLNEIIIEAPFEDRGVFVFEALSKATNQVGVKLTTIENSANYIRSWVTGEAKGTCPEKHIDWGFDGEIQWAHPFTQRADSHYRWMF
ncbi:hypothetical protein VN97_g2309 [Penicillium thymicola]|uniref:F-box domain-containing protein n=1 Tax=Penicillium thymicola TaxID=293382 RepID=A0AAI9XCB6_PENTH|nr:hypothetical protein VN97_g2309 [Penicillium thymicola]